MNGTTRQTLVVCITALLLAPLTALRAADAPASVPAQTDEPAIQAGNPHANDNDPAAHGAPPALLVLKADDFRRHVDAFNQNDNELYVQHIPNAVVWEFLKANIPLLDCPDKLIEEIYFSNGKEIAAAEKLGRVTGKLPVAAEVAPPETSAGWKKFEGNPVMGGKYGTCFDVSVLKEDSGYRMWLSWRPKKSVAIVESKDGFHWSEPPQIVLGPRPESGWEDGVNRPVVVKRGDGYHMWFTGQAKGRSWIGYATSPDGIVWKRMSDKPALSPEKPWEKVAVMCPHVVWDEEAKQFRMWYSGGEQYEPDAIGYATSHDGVAWAKHDANPIFRSDPNKKWEQHKVTACQVEKRGDWYLMFYIGFRDVHHAQIGVARSKDGITNWQRHPANPIIQPGKDKWDHDACYKPCAVFDGAKWLLWYNGRRGRLEQIGVVLHEGEDLGFDP